MHFRTHWSSLFDFMYWISSVSEDRFDLLFIEAHRLHFIFELLWYHLHSVPGDHLLLTILHIFYRTDITHIQGGILYHDMRRERRLLRQRVAGRSVIQSWHLLQCWRPIMIVRVKAVFTLQLPQRAGWWQSLATFRITEAFKLDHFSIRFTRFDLHDLRCLYHPVHAVILTGLVECL